MQLHSFRTLPKEAVPYSSEAMRRDLERVRDVWEDCQATRDRNAIYTYLNAVYRLVAWWAAEGGIVPIDVEIGQAALLALSR
jgi:hypothetical protein